MFRERHTSLRRGAVTVLVTGSTVMGLCAISAGVATAAPGQHSATTNHASSTQVNARKPGSGGLVNGVLVQVAGNINFAENLENKYVDEIIGTTIPG